MCEGLLLPVYVCACLYALLCLCVCVYCFRLYLFNVSLYAVSSSHTSCQSGFIIMKNTFEDQSREYLRCSCIIIHLWLCVCACMYVQPFELVADCVCLCLSVRTCA